jgi:hypothetical protein
MMRRSSVIVVVTLAVGCVLGFLGPIVSLAGQDASKPKLMQGEIGTWKLNLAKSKFDPADQAPKSFDSTREPDGSGVKVANKVINAQGKLVETQVTTNYDGKDYPVTGNPAYDTASVKLIDRFSSVTTRKKGGKVVQSMTIVMSKDGKVLTATVTGTDAQSRRIKNVFVFEKQ